MELLLKAGKTITCGHGFTGIWSVFVRWTADILIAGVGKPGLSKRNG